MYIKLIFKLTINNKQMYSPRLYKYRDSSVLYTPTEKFSVPYHTRILFWNRHKHITFPPPGTITIVHDHDTGNCAYWLGSCKDW